MSQPTVLIVEDDAAIRRGQADALRYAGYGVLEADDGETGLALALESDVDLVMLDVMLPRRDGFDILREVRAARPTLPVIMVTAKGAEDDRVRGLRDGADDYVTKPFSARELLARVEAVLRRSPERPDDVRELGWPGARVDLQRREIRFDDGGRRSLSAREAEILRYLAAHRERAVDRRELLHRVWGLDPRGLHSRTVDMTVARLREKLAGEIDGDQVVLTVRAKGYMLGDVVAMPGEPDRDATSVNGENVP